MMIHEGYMARIEFDEERNVFHGRVLNIKDVISFEASTVRELRKELAESVQFYIEMCKKDGIEPERPFSGKFVLRLAPDLHRSIALAAEREGKSINSWVKSALQQATSG